MKNGLPAKNGAIKTQVPRVSPSSLKRKPPTPLKSCCPRCKARLDIVQPDLNRGHALLGVCTRCPEWFLIDGRHGTLSDLSLAERLCASSLVAMAV